MKKVQRLRERKSICDMVSGNFLRKYSSNNMDLLYFTPFNNNASMGWQDFPSTLCKEIQRTCHLSSLQRGHHLLTNES